MQLLGETRKVKPSRGIASKVKVEPCPDTLALIRQSRCEFQATAVRYVPAVSTMRHISTTTSNSVTFSTTWTQPRRTKQEEARPEPLFLGLGVLL
jgi:hypothetical protein